MNQEELQQKIAEYYSKLSPQAQVVFSDMKWLETLENISEKYKLTEEQKQTIGTETMLLLLGITHTDEYGIILVDKLDLSEENTEKIISEIDDLVVKDILPQLTRAFYQNNTQPIEKLEEIFKTELVKQPKETQEVINTFGWEKISEEIGKKYSLNEKQTKYLHIQTGLILTEAVDLDLIVISIENTIGVNNETAINISEEVVNKILKPMAIKLTENIKNGLSNKTIHWQQNLDFIISGGDYTAFIKRVETNKKPTNTTNNINPQKITDLRSKFTI